MAHDPKGKSFYANKGVFAQPGGRIDVWDPVPEKGETKADCMAEVENFDGLIFNVSQLEKMLYCIYKAIEEMKKRLGQL